MSQFADHTHRRDETKRRRFKTHNSFDPNNNFASATQKLKRITRKFRPDFSWRQSVKGLFDFARQSRTNFLSNLAYIKDGFITGHKHEDD